MEGINLSTTEIGRDKLETYIQALELYQRRYQRGEIDLNSVVYAINEVQEAFFTELQASGKISGDVNYKDKYQSAITEDGRHYTKILSTETMAIANQTSIRQQLLDFIHKVSHHIDRGTIKVALEAANDPYISDQQSFYVMNQLFAKAYSQIKPKPTNMAQA